jgi:hypothetical protein
MEIQYHCNHCKTDFCVYNQNNERNTHCWWCGNTVQLTGRIAYIEGDEIVTYMNGIEIERRPKPNR